MRVGITCYPTYGGSGIVATELGLELAARGHQIRRAARTISGLLAKQAPGFHG